MNRILKKAWFAPTFVIALTLSCVVFYVQPWHPEPASVQNTTPAPPLLEFPGMSVSEANPIEPVPHFSIPALREYPRSDVSGALEFLKRPAKVFAHYYTVEHSLLENDSSALEHIEQHYGLPTGLLRYQGLKEASGRCPVRDNHKGANGCYQFMAATAKQFSLMGDTFDLRTHRYASAEASARYLVWLTVLFFNDAADPSDWAQMRYALAGYNAGFARMLKRTGIAIPNFYETQRYVHDIESLIKGTAYWVERGDSLAKISAETGWPMDVILKSNPAVRSDQDLRAETVLALPDPNTGLSALILRRGMTLSSVSAGTGVDIAELVAVNSLESADYISAGDVLHIPVE